MVWGDAVAFQIRGKYLKEQVRLATPAHPGYNLNHTVVPQGNEFIQVFSSFYMLHANRNLCHQVTEFPITKIRFLSSSLASLLEKSVIDDGFSG
jgi:hypothetical protein